MTVSNIAATGYNPPSATQTMGNMVDLARGVQGYQTGQIQQQSLGLKLQSEQQANQERQAVIQLVQNDPDFKPGPDGIIDQSKVMPKLMAAAPQTYNQYAQNIAQTNSGNATVNTALQGLDKDTRDSLGSIAGASVGQPRSVAAAQIQDWMDTNGTGANKAKVQLLGGKLLDSLNQAGDEQPKVDAVLQTAGLRTKAISDIIAARQPGVSIVNQGPQAQETVTQPNWSGKPQGAAVGAPIPMGVAPSYQLNSLQQPTYLPGRMPNWQSQPPSAAPPAKGNAGTNVPAMPAFPNMIQAQNAKDAQTRWSASQTRDVDPASGYNATSQVYKNLGDLLDKNPDLGPGSAGLNALAGRIGTFTGHAVDPNAAYQETAGYLDRLAAQNSAATGAATNFAREQQANSTGNPQEMGPTAIREKLRFGASVNEAAHAYTVASQQFVAKHGDNAYANPQLFESSWSQNADPVAFRMMAALKNGDTKDFAATQARVAQMPASQQAEIHAHYLNLKNYLLKGMLPPNG